MVIFAFEQLGGAQSQPMPAPTACHALTQQMSGTAHVAREGDHFVVDLEVVLSPSRSDAVLGPSVTGAYGVDRVIRTTVTGGAVRVRFIPRADFTTAQIEIPTRCATGTQVTIASVITGMLSRMQTLPPTLAVQVMER